MGPLPGKGESPIYKQRIRERIRQLRESLYSLAPIIVPVEVDVQVMPSHRTRLAKDLDNIMRDIAPIIHEELLDSNAYIYGYRIYVVANRYANLETGSIRLKLLSAGCIGDFDETVVATLDAAEDWLKTFP